MRGLSQFITDSQNSVPYADWNFDGVFDGHLGNGADRVMFNADYAAGCCP